MGLWNNVKHLKRNFFLLILNMLVLYFLFLNISVSTLVFIATIPAIIYSIYSKRYFLIGVVLLTYISIIAVFFIAILSPVVIGLGLEQISLIFYIYSQIYPFGLTLNIYHLLGVQALFYMLIFMFFVLFFGGVFKFDEFKLMIIFSFFIGLFTALHLVLNIFCFIIPIFEVILFHNLLFSWIILIFYVVLPFFTLILMLLYFELLLIDVVKRRDYQKDSIEFNSPKNNPKISYVTKIMGISLLILVIVLIFVGISL